MSKNTNTKKIKPTYSEGNEADLSNLKFYGRLEAAHLVGISPETLRAWIRDGVFIPKYRVPRGTSGNLFRYAYSNECINDLRKIKGSRKPGRPVGTLNTISIDNMEVLTQDD